MKLPLTALLASCSYLYVEQPLRFGNLKTKLLPFLASLGQHHQSNTSHLVTLAEKSEARQKRAYRGKKSMLESNANSVKKTRGPNAYR